MGNGQSIDDVFDVQGSFIECGTDDLSLNVLSARTLAENQVVTVFYYTASTKFRDVLSSCHKYSRVLRHPKLVKVLSTELSSSNDRLTVVTEPVRPLSALLEGAAASVLHAAEVAWHVHGLLEALVFLHSGQVSHNNVGEQCVFVSSDGTWKLGRLECAHQLSSGSGGMEYLGKVSMLVSAGRVPGDGGPPGLGNDLYGLNRLFEALKDKLSDLGSREVDDFGERLAQLLEACDSASTSRPLLSSLLDHAIFRTEFQQIVTFLSEITVKSEASKAAFFSSLLPRLRTLPPGLIARCLVKRLLTRFVVLDRAARQHVLPALLTPRWKPHELAQAEQLRVVRHCSCHVCSVDGLLPVDEFGSSVLVIVLKLFRVQDSQARLLVLEHFHAYCVLFDLTCLRKAVMPLIVRSLHDSSSAVVSLALRALADMVPMLGAEAVIGSPRQKLLYDGSPMIAAAAPDAAVAGAESEADTSRGSESSAGTRTYTRVVASRYDEEPGMLRAPAADSASHLESLLSDDRSNHQSVGRGELQTTSTRGQVRQSRQDRVASETAVRPTGPSQHLPDSEPDRAAASSSSGDGKQISKSSSLHLGSRMPRPPSASLAEGTASKAIGSPQPESGANGHTIARPVVKGKAMDADALDIKSLTIKVKQHDEADIDFFADMAPAIALTSAGARSLPLQDGSDAATRLERVSSAKSSATKSHLSTVSSPSSSSSSSTRGREQATSAMTRSDEVSDWGDAEAWPDSDW